MLDIKDFFKRKTFYTNKYFIAIFLFVVYITIFSQNNLIERIAAIKKRNELIRQKEYYLKLIKEHSEKIKELTTNKDLLEKFVREEYLMKRKDEIIFLIKDSFELKK
jgi:cell division protein FtsB